MPRATALAATLLAGLAAASWGPGALAQPETVRVGIDIDLDPETGSARLALTVEEPGPVIRLTVELGDLEATPSAIEPSAAWERAGTSYTATFPGPTATLSYTVDARVRATTLEGKGFTSYVGPEFAIVRLGDVLPQLAYAFPENRPPRLAFALEVHAPAAWSVAGPWPSTGAASFLADELPQGFLAAGPLAVVEYDAGSTRVTAVRVAGAQEPDAFAGIVSAGRTYLGALYGSTPERLHVVVAPDPMYKGGLASPFGMFLHDDADESTAAHELVHVHQAFQPRARPPDATIWFLEGAAVLHGALTEVVAGGKTLEQAQDALQQAWDRSVKKPGIVAEAGYGSDNERAAYDQGALIIASLDRIIREATSGSRGLGDLLGDLNAQRAGEAIDNGAIRRAVANLTGSDPADFFATYVFGPDVPDVVPISPEALVLRLAGTRPAPAVEGDVTAILEARNLGVRDVTLAEPARLDALPVGQLQAEVPVGATRTIELPLGRLQSGTHSLAIGSWRFTVPVLRPPDATFETAAFPLEPAAGDVLAVAVRVTNSGEAAWSGSLRLLVDGVSVDTAAVDVPGGTDGVASLSTVLAASGPARVAVDGPDGEVWSAQLDVLGPRDAPAGSWGPLLAAVLTLAALARGRRRS